MEEEEEGRKKACRRIDRPTRPLSDLRRSSVLADLLWADVDLNDVSELLDGSLGPSVLSQAS